MNRIYLTEDDYQQLFHLTQMRQQQQDLSPSNIRLKEELNRAQRLPSEKIPPDVVTMNSQVRVLEQKSGSEMEVTIVYPHEADFNAGKLSVLLPLGTAILGSREGDEVTWSAPSRKFIYRIQQVMYQPEACRYGLP
jgi:regulator of nucleoside diphosphate kinase